jgi:hypothetical protein
MQRCAEGFNSGVKGLMLYGKITAVSFQIHTKHINTLCGQNVELLNVKPEGTYSNHYLAVLKHKFCKTFTACCLLNWIVVL